MTIQLAPRASLVVVLLLASVGTASAECAWVLWGFEASVGWLPLLGYETRAECDADRKDKQSNIKDGILTCLPDTIDPRGPKAR